MRVILDDNGTIEAFEGMPDELYAIYREASENAVLGVRQKVVNNFGTSHDKLKVRSGRLIGSLVTRVTGNSIENLDARVTAGGGRSPIKYAKLQEFGGTITPKNGKYSGVEGGPYLNIPLRDNKTASGVMRKSARQVFSEGGTIFKSRAGKWFVKSNRNKLMFILLKSVRIPARLGMRKAHEEQTRIMMREIQAMINSL